MDNRARRSAGKNLIGECNRWVSTIIGWLDRHGAIDLMERLGFAGHGAPKVNLFVLGRYHVHFSGYNDRDRRAIWSDWAQFRRVCNESTDGVFAEILRSDIKRTSANKQSESTMFPVGNIAVVLNPSTMPEQG